jgi:hypothetical protein
MASTYEPIATYTASNTPSITFNSFSGYTDLVIVSTLNRTTANSGASQLRIQFNSDTGSNYSYTRIYGNGSTAASDRGSSQTYINPFSAGDPNTGVVNTINIMNYANTTTYKTVLGRASNGDANGFAYANVALWRSTAAITSITLFSTENFASGTATLYGIKAA